MVLVLTFAAISVHSTPLGDVSAQLCTTTCEVDYASACSSLSGSLKTTCEATAVTSCETAIALLSGCDCSCSGSSDSGTGSTGTGTSGNLMAAFLVYGVRMLV